MPHGSDPRRRPDQQSPDSGASVPPSWWNALTDTRLPTEGTGARRRISLPSRLGSWGVRLSVPALILAVAGAVVAASFGYQLVAGAAAAVVVLALASATLVHHRRTRAVEDTAWWR
jgi:hypothetical protein